MTFVLENQLRIQLANSELFNVLMRSSRDPEFSNVIYYIFEKSKISHFRRESNVYFLNNSDVWFSFIKGHEKYIYAFGMGKVSKDETFSPIIVFDFPINGIKTSTGAFAQDQKGYVVLLHKDNFPKSLKFLKTSEKYKWIEVAEKDELKKYLFLAKLKDEKFVQKIIEFVKYIDLVIYTQDKDKPTEKFKEKSKSKTNNLEGTDQDISNHGFDKMNAEEKIVAVKSLNIIKKHTQNRFFTQNSIMKEIGDSSFESNLKLLKDQSLLSESGSGIYFIPLRAEKFLKENLELFTANEDSHIDEEASPSCEICGQTLHTDGIESVEKKICKDCGRKSHAATALMELRNYVEPNTVFQKNDILDQVDNRMQFLDYIWTLQELDLLWYDDTSNEYRLKSENELDAFQEKYGIITTIVPKPFIVEETSESPVKQCPMCNKSLSISRFYKSTTSEDGYSEKCKDCSRKSHAAKSLDELLNFVEPDVFFLKNDLLDQVDNKMQFLDYIWTLQELDLLEHDETGDKYKLKTEPELIKFQEKYGNAESKSIKPAKKVVKTCPVCDENLSISKFYKSTTSDDGLTENCKECSDKINAAKILEKIQEYMKMDVPFTKEELSQKLKDSNQVNSYIWTLQEHDLLEHNPQADTYQIKINSKFEEFVNRYLKEPVEVDREVIVKEVESFTGPQFIIERKEIIYISDNFDGNKVNLIMNAVIKNDELIKELQGLNSFIISNLNKFLVFKCSEEHSEVMIDLEIDKEDKNNALGLLEEKNWDNKVIL